MFQIKLKSRKWLKLKRFYFIIPVLLVTHTFYKPLALPSIATSSEESLTLYNVEVDEHILHYYLYMPPKEPIGAVLVIPYLLGDHSSYLLGDFWERPEENMLESPIVQTAKVYGFALVFAEGAKADLYSSSNGEKKVLACMEDANTTIIKLSSEKWFIYGFSMGGTGSLTITVRHPNLFNGLFSGGGIPDFRNEVWLIQYRRKWVSDEQILAASPHHHLEAFNNKAIFLATGTGDYVYHTYDNFSKLLDINKIRHHYHRGDEGHTYHLLINTLNQTFTMFSQQIEGTLDTFFEDYVSPLDLIVSTEVSNTLPISSTKTSKTANWSRFTDMITLTLFSVWVLLIRREKN